MTFDETLARVLEFLQHEGRVSYRALRRRFDLDEEYLANGSRQRPLIFEVEDLHWIDTTSDEFLALLGESLAGNAAPGAHRRAVVVEYGSLGHGN